MMKKIIFVILFCLIVERLQAGDWYVSPTGNNTNAGTKEAPLKEIDKAMEKAVAGDKIHVSEGTYMATFGVGYYEIKKTLEFYGGYKSDFSERNPFKYFSLIQPPADAFSKSANRNVMDMKMPLDNCVIDGFVFEGGVKTPYSSDPNPDKSGKPEGCETGMMLVGPGQKNPEGVMLVVYGNGHIVRNNIFVNSSFGGVRVKIGQGKTGGDIIVENNVFVANRMFGIEGFGLAGSKPGNIRIKNNTILFSWSRQKDLLDFGYGINCQNNANFIIENNVIGLNIASGVAQERFNKSMTVNNNIFFGNKKKDITYSPASNTKVTLDASEFGDLDFTGGAVGNKNANEKLSLNNAYLKGFLQVQYSEQTDFDPNSQANQIRAAYGMNKQGTMTTKVSMYANRYPWKETLSLVGAVNNAGCQLFK